jgi:hypothetical protein
MARADPDFRRWRTTTLAGLGVVEQHQQQAKKRQRLQCRHLARTLIFRRSALALSTTLLFLLALCFLLLLSLPRATTALASRQDAGRDGRRSSALHSTEPAFDEDAGGYGYDYEDDADTDTDTDACDASMALRAPGAVSARASAAASSGTSPCVPLAALRFQTPAAALAHRYAQRHRGTALLKASSASSSASASSSHPAACSAELCSIDGPEPAAVGGAFAAAAPGGRGRNARASSVVAHATPPKMGAVAAQQAKLAAQGGKKAWYEQHADVWTELTSEEDFYAFLDGGGEDGGDNADSRLVLVGE